MYVGMVIVAEFTEEEEEGMCVIHFMSLARRTFLRSFLPTQVVRRFHFIVIGNF